jgi:hemoglobin-like flavoprotein
MSMAISDRPKVNQALIVSNLETVAERAGDITPLVFERLFARYPEMEPLFFRDHNGAIKGNMLFRAIDCFLDVGEGDYYGGNVVHTEMIHHRDDLEVPSDVFRTFFEVVVETVQAVMDSDWTTEMAEAWSGAISAMDAVTER